MITELERFSTSLLERRISRWHRPIMGQPTFLGGVCLAAARLERVPCWATALYVERSVAV